MKLVCVSIQAHSQRRQDKGGRPLAPSQMLWFGRRGCSSRVYRGPGFLRTQATPTRSRRRAAANGSLRVCLDEAQNGYARGIVVVWDVDHFRDVTLTGDEDQLTANSRSLQGVVELTGLGR